MVGDDNCYSLMTENEMKRLKELSDAVEENKAALARAHELIEQLRRQLESTRRSASALQRPSPPKAN
jgi:uncharacterized coiled-coil protein SlyX